MAPETSSFGTGVDDIVPSPEDPHPAAMTMAAAQASPIVSRFISAGKVRYPRITVIAGILANDHVPEVPRLVLRIEHPQHDLVQPVDCIVDGEDLTRKPRSRKRGDLPGCILRLVGAELYGELARREIRFPRKTRVGRCRGPRVAGGTLPVGAPGRT